MNFKRDWWKVVLVLLVLALLLRNPVTRAIILFILPLGRGVDDFLFVALLVIALTIAFIKGWISLPSWFKETKHEKLEK